MEDLSGHVVAVSAGRAQALRFDGREDRSAFVKKPIEGPVHIGELGIEGDEHVFELHGGPDQALLVYSSDHYSFWTDEYGLELPPVSAFAENLTVTGLTEDIVMIGDVFRIGGVTAQVTIARGPCYKIGYRYRDRRLPVVMQDLLIPGYMMRILETGYLQAGDEMRLIERQDGSVTVAEAARVESRDRDDWEAAAHLASLPYAADALRRELAARVAERDRRDHSLRLFGEEGHPS